jgi:hypothetical protein
MPAPESASAVQIGEWIVHPAFDSISRGTETHKLEPRAMRLLMYLANSAARSSASIDCLTRCGAVWSWAPRRFMKRCPSYGRFWAMWKRSPPISQQFHAKATGSSRRWAGPSRASAGLPKPVQPPPPGSPANHIDSVGSVGSSTRSSSSRQAYSMPSGNSCPGGTPPNGYLARAWLSKIVQHGKLGWAWIAPSMMSNAIDMER